MTDRALVVGVDEAGYGPLLGPLVVSASIFEVDVDRAVDDLWETLREVPVVRPGSPSGGGLVVGDSKQLYSSGRGLGKLEAGVLSFARAAGFGDLTNLAAYLGHSGHGDPVAPEGCPWYSLEGVCMPVEAGELGFLESLQSVLARTRIQFHGFLVRPVFEPEFNTEVERTGNKARLLFDTSVSLAESILDRFREHREFLVLYDKQGSRRAYGQLLLERFPDSGLLIECERRELSAYQLLSKGRRALHRFVLKGDDRHLPIALASMCSKYVRELLMMELNAFWGSHLPGLRPTAGYYTDAQRFLKETKQTRLSLGVADRDFVRCR